VRKNRGFTLLEIMVALAILSMTLVFIPPVIRVSESVTTGRPVSQVAQVDPLPSPQAPRMATTARPKAAAARRRVGESTSRGELGFI